MKKGRKDFIKKLHDGAWSGIKKEIEKEFPKLFKEDNKVIGWYFAEDSKVFLHYFNGTEKAYGFSWGKVWSNNLSVSSSKGDKASDKEVEQALIKEAKKRGFKEGVRFTCLYNKFIIDDCHPMLCSEGYLWIKGGCVFRDGKWATIIKETITKEQAEKELGKTILN